MIIIITSKCILGSAFTASDCSGGRISGSGIIGRSSSSSSCSELCDFMLQLF